MALVRVSKILLMDVKNKIVQMKDLSHKKVIAPMEPAKDKALEDQLFDVGLDKLWGEHKHFMTELPKTWLRITQRMDVQIIEAEHKIPEIMITRNFAIPGGVQHYTYIEVKIKAASVPVSCMEKIKVWAAALREHEKKYNEVAVQVRAFLESCKSLNDAVKRYPDLLLYIPQHYKDSMEEKRVAKDKKEKAPVPEINRDLITSIAVIDALRK